MYELCCDMIDLLINMSEIYGQPNGNDQTNAWTEPNENERSLSNGNHSYSNGKITIKSVEKKFLRKFLLDVISMDDYHQQSCYIETTDQPASNVFDSMSSSVIKLTGGRVLYLKEINRHLALICVLREEALTKQAIIDYNVKQLKESILKLFRLNHPT